jgi:cytoplasmic iron level regulating protein YaaA (DUF328/UPF0246 family)
MSHSLLEVLNVSILMVLSPAKSLDYETPPSVATHTLPQYIPQAYDLIKSLRGFTPAQIGGLMDISDALATLNVARYELFSETFTPENSKQALLAFNGDVYEGLNAAQLSAEQLDFAQNHLRILSGLYGLLKPLDLMQPYRLEMGTKLPNAMGKDLYAFWRPLLADALNALLPQSDDVLVNLASEEYFKSVDLKRLKVRVVSPVFEDYKNGKYKIISFYAKRARGLMARYVIDQRLSSPESLKGFDYEGYAFDPEVSTENTWTFRRKLENL